jgi:hypothetical protein
MKSTKESPSLYSSIHFYADIGARRRGECTRCVWAETVPGSEPRRLAGLDVCPSCTEDRGRRTGGDETSERRKLRMTK